jgi:CheY-like chemotaxis protein
MAAYTSNTAPDTSDRKGRYVLIVDSDVANLSYLSVLLQRFDYQIKIAATAEEALAITAVAVPWVIIVSLDLNDMTGYELMQRLQQNPDTVQVHLIGLSGREDLEAKKRCFELGAVGCLYEPVEAEQLYRAVQVAVEKNPRTRMRVRTVLPVMVNNMPDDSLYGAYTLDLSERGMFLRTMNPADVNTRLLIEIEADNRIIEAEAVVLYTCKTGEGPYNEPGIGLEFTRIDPKDQEFLRKFIMFEITKGITEGNA